MATMLLFIMFVAVLRRMAMRTVRIAIAAAVTMLVHIFV